MNLIVADSNMDYAARLSAVIAQSYKQSFSIKVFSVEQKLVQFLHKNSADVLLVDLSLANVIAESNNIGLVLVLVEDNELLLDIRLKDYQIINKYQRVSKIVQRIFDYYADSSPGSFYTLKTRETSKVIVCFSPGGGVGKSTIAIAMSCKYTMLGHRSFYLNLEKFSSTGVFFKAGPGKGMSELLKCLHQGSDLELKIKSLCRQDTATGVLFFNQPDNILDIEAVTVDDLRQIISELISCGLCDYLIVDTSADISATNIELFDMADQLVIISDLSKANQQRLQQLENAGLIFAERRHKTGLIINKANIGNPLKTKIHILARIPLMQIDDPGDLAVYIAQNCPIKLLCQEKV